MFELRNWYRERVSSRIEALEQARKNLKKRPRESLEAIRRIAHALRGSGATYGFPEITRAARKVEEAESRDLKPSMERLFQALRAAVEGVRTERHSVLIIEDDDETSQYAKTVLDTPGRDVYVARTSEEAQAILSEREISLVLLDLILPDSDGRSLLMKFRDRLATAVIPIIVMSVRDTPEVRSECRALGADEFLAKPIDPDVLRRWVADRLKKGSEMTREFRQDPLTGLANRAAFLEYFQRARCIAAESREPLSMALLDLDRFKGINDAHGHAMGDQILRRVANVVCRTLRSSDMVSRWGGDEFAVLMPQTDVEGARRALEKALEALHREEFRVGESATVQIAFSAGVGAVSCDMTLEAIMAEVDRLLYLAKEEGPNRVMTATEEVKAPRKRILVAEDDELMRMVTKQILMREGYDVTAVDNGEDALQAALDTPFAMVLTDVQMPRMDGFELLARLRNLGTMAQVPIVMVTSVGNEHDVVRGFETGADDYVLKPFSAVELTARIRRLLKKS